MSTRLENTINELKTLTTGTEQAKSIIDKCAVCAAGASLVGSTIPVLGIPAILFGSVGVIWAMYAKICKALGISIRQKTLHLLSRAVITNISMNALGLLASCLIPGAGVVTSAALTFVTVYLAGSMFLEMVLGMMKKNLSIEELSDEELKAEMSSVKIRKADILETRELYTKKNNDKAVTETTDPAV